MLRAFLSRSVASPTSSGLLSPLPARFYASSVFALTVFFVGLTIWRVPVEGYLVTSEVGVADAHDPPWQQLAEGGWRERGGFNAISQQQVADAILRGG